ncbi:ATP-binding protein [Kitasatospora sp. NPDC048540]|uniref:ATP-binding protein n=1 Tax=Kitasatospora sp. NPDC048540 TaxID=3155634 RepID=UPI00053B14AD
MAALPCLWVLPHLPESAGTARRIARHALSEWGVGEDAADQVLLVVSELVTNAVEHALPPVALRVDVPDEGMVHVEVADGGPAEQEGEWITSCAPDEHGRGSGIIDFLAASHGCCTRAGRSTHWADMPTAA